jgi:CBS domain-containing membrane protein
MQSDVVTIAPGVALAEAAELMSERKIGCLPVVDGERLVGILTEGDFLTLIVG